jgi:hypothetical protein
MREKSGSLLGFLSVLVACALAGALVSTTHAAFDERLSVSADTVVVRNLIGQIDVEGHGGSDFEIEVRVQGDDATPERVQVRLDEGRRAEVIISFPLDESRRYVYPRLKGGKVSFGTEDHGGNWLTKLLGGGGSQIRVAGRGSGLEIWADATVRVPTGSKIVVEHGVGTIRALDVEADLDLSSMSGPVEVAGATGSVSVDTGSGHVSVEHVRGALHLDTGSGHVSVSDVQAKDIHVDTGSGGVGLERVDGSTVHVDTGSGGVKAEGVSADDLMIDSGSGSVTLQLDRMGAGEFMIDTGSGSIDLRLPPDASADVRADTGSGGIDFDLTGEHRLQRVDDDEARLTIGSGDAEVMLDTGSGSIRISQ